MADSSHMTQVATVRVEIDYAILQHFSKHLYSSPNKAVEELVTNGYDALATNVRVYLPGEAANDCVLVWDDGDSMDIEGIQRLWWIARSPKDDGGDRIARNASGSVERAMIGKFGIGKLASYAVGSQISHLCHRDGKYYRITVDYNDAPRLDDETQTNKGFDVPVIGLPEAEAKVHLQSLFNSRPANFEAIWRKPSWTVAIIELLREDIKLTPGRLQWVLGIGMPSRPDFNVFVNGIKVSPKIESGAFATWNICTPEVKAQLDKDWNEAKKNHTVSGIINFDDKDATVKFPQIGDVKAQIKLFKESIYKPNREDAGRSEGFFVMVRGRLLNPDDPKLLLPDPSYGAFRRMQIVLDVDGLDSELLADRERLHRASPIGAELLLIQNAIYRAARSKIYAQDALASEEADTGIHQLPALGREIVLEPLTALIVNDEDGDISTIDASQTRVTSEAAGGSQPIVRIDATENKVLVNTDHPMFTVVHEEFGDNKKGRVAQKLVEMFAISDLLLRGHLLDVGVELSIVEKIMAWRETLLRSMAQGFNVSPELVIKDVMDASFKGQRPFENALAKLFRLMGFKAEVDGRSGQKDVLIVAPIGSDEKKFTVEAKGSKKAIQNDAAEISGASSHAKAAGASFSLVVAREFTGFVRERADGAEPQTLQECRTQEPPVSIVTVPTLVSLYKAVHNFQYPLSTIVNFLKKIESPSEKEENVKTLEDPAKLTIDWRGVLDTIWSLQQGTASGEPVPMNQVRQSRSDWKEKITLEDFERILIAFESVSGRLLVVETSTKSVTLLQHPSIVGDRIDSVFGDRKDNE